ncbi:MAG: hypothetical protein LBH39_02585 [Clostridiales Family XIII bacterium]|nr:hypothetical protein [Clostridiales Family XIII bacterium]
MTRRKRAEAQLRFQILERAEGARRKGKEMPSAVSLSIALAFVLVPASAYAADGSGDYVNAADVLPAAAAAAQAQGTVPDATVGDYYSALLDEGAGLAGFAPEVPAVQESVSAGPGAGLQPAIAATPALEEFLGAAPPASTLGMAHGKASAKVDSGRHYKNLERRSSDGVKLALQKPPAPAPSTAGMLVGEIASADSIDWSGSAAEAAAYSAVDIAGTFVVGIAGGSSDVVDAETPAVQASAELAEFIDKLPADDADGGAAASADTAIATAGSGDASAGATIETEGGEGIPTDGAVGASDSEDALTDAAIAAEGGEGIPTDSAVNAADSGDAPTDAAIAAEDEGIPTDSAVNAADSGDAPTDAAIAAEGKDIGKGGAGRNGGAGKGAVGQPADIAKGEAGQPADIGKGGNNKPAVTGDGETDSTEPTQGDGPADVPTEDGTADPAAGADAILPDSEDDPDAGPDGATHDGEDDLDAGPDGATPDGDGDPATDVDVILPKDEDQALPDDIGGEGAGTDNIAEQADRPLNYTINFSADSEGVVYGRVYGSASDRPAGNATSIQDEFMLRLVGDNGSSYSFSIFDGAKLNLTGLPDGYYCAAVARATYGFELDSIQLGGEYISENDTFVIIDGEMESSLKVNFRRSSKRIFAMVVGAEFSAGVPDVFDLLEEELLDPEITDGAIEMPDLDVTEGAIEMPDPDVTEGAIGPPDEDEGLPPEDDEEIPPEEPGKLEDDDGTGGGEDGGSQDENALPPEEDEGLPSGGPGKLEDDDMDPGEPGRLEDENLPSGDPGKFEDDGSGAGGAGDGGPESGAAGEPVDGGFGPEEGEDGLEGKI